MAIREARLEAIKAAERYGNVSINSSEEEGDGRTKCPGGYFVEPKRFLSRGQGWPARRYCRLMRYDLENAARAINGLQHMAGEYADEQTRKNTVNYVYYNLNAQGHLSDEDLLALRIALKERSQEIRPN